MQKADDIDAERRRKKYAVIWSALGAWRFAQILAHYGFHAMVAQ